MPSNQDYFDASYLAYGESTTGGLETMLLSSPSENQLINDQDIYLAKAGLSSWIPISVDYIPKDGFYSVAYRLPSGNIIISFEGTVDDQLSTYALNSLLADNEIDSNKTPSAFLDAQNFALSIVVANSSSSQISVTGHSLGGDEAEYVAAKLGLGGVAFGAPGLPTYTGAPSASSFKTYVDYGDPVGNYASNMPYVAAPKFQPFSGENHVGSVLMVGSTSNGDSLATAAIAAKTKLFASDFLMFHDKNNYAYDLGLSVPGGVSIGGGAVAQQDDSDLDPVAILASLDESLGTHGSNDFVAASVLSDSEIQSPNFTISVNTSNATATIIQNQALMSDSGAVSSPIGTDIVNFDPANLAVASEVFTQASGGIYGFVPDISTLGYSQVIQLQAGEILFIQNSRSFAGSISKFVPGDTIDLAGIGTATNATLGTNDVLTVAEADGSSVKLQLDPTQNYASYDFIPIADGHGGTDIVLPTVKILATFTGPNGANPKGGLIEDSAGNLFGTTAGGGAYSDGTAFEIPKTATGYGALTTLVSFNTSSSSAGPMAGLVADSAGNLFGTTYGGGASRAGSVFEIAKGATAPTILASFNAGAASTTTGSGPQAGLVMDSAGNLFGTTTYGGADGVDGAVFEVPKAAVGYSTLRLLTSFNFTDGTGPKGSLMIDSAGNLIGTTPRGGAFGGGTVFEISKTGGTPTTVVNFNGTDGSGPDSNLITDSAGDLFGTTYLGGSPGKAAGTVFKIKKTGTTYASTPTTLVSFPSTAGYEPMGGLIMDAAGDLFGTTSMGGPNGAGTVFEIKTANTSTGYASIPVVVSDAFNFSGFGGQLLADRTTGNLFVPSGGGGGYGTEVEIINSGFVTTAPTAIAATAASPVTTTTVAAGSTLNVTNTESIPNLVENGTVAIASGGSLDVSSAVDPSSTGIFQLTGNASLEIAAALGTGLKIQFLGSESTNKLTLDSAANFGAQIGTASYAGPLLESFTAGDMIDLKGIASAGLGLAYSTASGDLQITGSSGSPLATLAFQNSTLGAGNFHAASDGLGGTLITHS